MGLRRIHTRRRGFSIVRGFVEDGSGRLPVVWFNRPYLANQIANQADEGEYLLHGPVKAAADGLELVNPSCEPAAQAIHGDRITPIYPAAGKVSPAALRQLLDGVLREIDLPAQVPETVPGELLQRYGLPPLGEALQALHHPEEDADVEALNQRRSPAHLRLVYGELLELQVALALVRRREEAVPRARRYRLGAGLRRTLAEIPPFPPDRRPGAGDGGDPGRPRRPSPHAPPAPGGRRERQDDRRRPGAGGRAGERLSGGVHGALPSCWPSSTTRASFGCWGIATGSSSSPS